MDNRTLLAKADLALADLLANGGLMEPAQAQKFMRLMIKQAVILPMATVVPMRAPKQLIEKIRFGSRILRAGVEAQALAEADRVKPDLAKVELDAKLFKAQVNLDNETLEDNIERGDLRQTIMDMLGEAIARDMDEVIINGDTTSGDLFLAQFNGMLAAATSHVYDATLQTASKPVWKAMLRTMPPEYLRAFNALRFLTSVNAEIDYRDSLADRGTVLGDRALMEELPVSYSSVPVLRVPMFPENLGIGANCTNAVLTDPKNLTVGIWRDIRIETDKDIERGVLKVVASLRFDFKFTHEPSVVKGINIKVS